MPSKFSRASITLQHYSILRHKATRHTPPGRMKTHPLRCITTFYVNLLFNNCFSRSKSYYLRTQWRWRDLNPRPSPCKGAALPLSYIPRTCCPEFRGGVGLTGFEPVTPALSAQCSNQLSYKPAVSITLTTE